MAVDETRMMTREDVKDLVAEVLYQHQAPPSEPNTLKDGNSLTLSIFSELQFALRSRNVGGTAPVAQQFPAVITANGYLEFPEGFPHWARRISVVYRGHASEKYDLPATGDPDPIQLKNHSAALAVKIEDADKNVRLLTFVSFVGRSTAVGQKQNNQRSREAR